MCLEFPESNQVEVNLTLLPTSWNHLLVDGYLMIDREESKHMSFICSVKHTGQRMLEYSWTKDGVYLNTGNVSVCMNTNSSHCFKLNTRRSSPCLNLKYNLGRLLINKQFPAFPFKLFSR